MTAPPYPLIGLNTELADGMARMPYSACQNFRLKSAYLNPQSNTSWQVIRLLRCTNSPAFRCQP
jgi:hypothetical protein